MSKLTIVAHVYAKPDQVELVKAELDKLESVRRGLAQGASGEGRAIEEFIKEL